MCWTPASIGRTIVSLGSLAKILLPASYRSPRRLASLCFGPGPLSIEELRRFVRAAYPHALHPRELRSLSFEEVCVAIVDQFAKSIPVDEAERFGRLASSLTPVAQVMARKVLVKNECLSRSFKPTRKLPGKITIYACDGNDRVYAWQPHAMTPLDVKMFPIAGVAGRDAHTAMLDPMNVELFAPSLRRLLEPCG